MSADINSFNQAALIAAPRQCAGVLFTLDMIIHFHTGVVTVEHSTASLIMGGREVAQHYIWHGSFFIDFLATVPSWVEVRTYIQSAFCSLLASVRTCHACKPSAVELLLSAGHALHATRAGLASRDRSS